MKCLICGGELKFSNGIYICENCGNKQTVSSFFENTDVFICYTESDDQGRRTKDSILAQDLYNKLENENIRTFYQRVSVADLTGNDFVEGYEEAINHAKIIIIMATSKDFFQELLNENRKHFTNKKILPVYSGINPYDIPEELAELQSMNYDGIGAVTDLTENILKLLGRENEIDTKGIVNKKAQKNILLSISAVLLIIIVTGTYILFGTPYILKSKKYDFAQTLVSNGQYIDAISMYSKIQGYKDSDVLLKNIYNKYNGYYENATTSLCITIQIVDNIAVDISCEYDGTSFSITAPLIANRAEFDFVDTQANQGNGTLALTDTGIDVNINSNAFEGKKASFSIEDKTDRKVNRFDKELLLSWLSGQMTIDKLKAGGYAFEFKNYIHAQLGSIYSLKDYPIEVFADYNESVIVVSAPAALLCPEKVGQSAHPYVDTDTLYAPYGTFPNSSIYSITSYGDVDDKTIESNTVVYVTKKLLVDEGAWEMMMNAVNK